VFEASTPGGVDEAALILAIQCEHVEGDIAGRRSLRAAAGRAPGEAQLKMIETQPAVDPHHRFPVQNGPRAELELGRGGQIGEGGGQVGASARPQSCAARRSYYRDPESVELQLVATAARAGRLLRDCICWSSKGEVHWSRESGRKGSRSGHASRMRGCAVGAWPDLRPRASSKWMRTHTDGSARRRRAVSHALEMILLRRSRSTSTAPGRASPLGVGGSPRL
jgi:hypothetical protein